jgi:hypothetical protein
MARSPKNEIAQLARTVANDRRMSAFGGKADIVQTSRNVRF